ncbi:MULTISPECIES: hypothetical protein [Nostocales]|uniref:Uncharacterized protein n=3 Tax=Nostocales TaxID=1161 RepID=A0A0C1RLW7_9CYAN|nr:hypothetical protein [Tolypothrix bouteillei]KAF3888121.1 hypothetical protein DA73_0400023465 [Tolypothrix bouteillei VB521301]
MSLEIFIDYKIANEPQWHTVEMSPEEYFDLNLLDEDEELVWNSVPEYNHAIEYLDVEPSLVSHTRLRIKDSTIQKFLTITTTFWHHGQNFIIERSDKESGEPEIVIINTKLQEAPTVWEIMKFHKKNDLTELEFHTFIRDNEDGSQTEKKIFPDEV